MSLPANYNQTFTQSFSLTLGQQTYPLSLTNGISVGNFSGTLQDNINISHE